MKIEVTQPRNTEWQRAAGTGLAFLLLTASAAILLGPTSLQACLWDRDTLAEEAESRGALLETLTGRFPRYPDTYYEMRLARVTEEIKSTPDVLSLYDDAGVAADRLHRGAEAIAWMKRKKAILDETENDKSEHLYRYHANLGTFLFHDWIRNGANKESVQQAKKGRSHIVQAIAINPEAHFGREKYQELAMRWIIRRIDKDTDDLLFEYETLGEDAIEGLSGLIRLGDAWKSPDLFYGLSRVLLDSSDTSLAMLAHLRCKELLKSGAKSFAGKHLPRGLEQENPAYRLEDGPADLEIWYRDARIEADAWQAARNTYLETHLAQGRHPDTHEQFWDDFTYSDSPPMLPFRFYRYSKHEFVWMALGGILLLGPVLLLIWFVLRLRRSARTS